MWKEGHSHFLPSFSHRAEPRGNANAPTGAAGRRRDRGVCSALFAFPGQWSRCLMVRFYTSLLSPATSMLLSARGHVRQERALLPCDDSGPIADLEARPGAPSGAQNADKGRFLAWLGTARFRPRMNGSCRVGETNKPEGQSIRRRSLPARFRDRVASSVILLLFDRMQHSPPNGGDFSQAPI